LNIFCYIYAMIIERTFYAIQCDSCKIKAKNYEDVSFGRTKAGAGKRLLKANGTKKRINITVQSAIHLMKKQQLT